MAQKYLTLFNQFLWFGLIILLPITSMPAVAQLLGSDTVAAPSILFLGLLVILWFLPNLIKSLTFPREIIPFIFFMLAAVISTFSSWFLDIPAYKGISIITNDIQTLFTLIIGACFYLIASTFPSDRKVLKKTYRIINWSGLIMLMWAAIQATSWFMFEGYPEWMFNLQGLISSRVLYRQRINAFALEPSWWAHMLNLVYIPLWLAASVKKVSYHSFRIWFMSLENILLAGGIIGMFFTFSRVGILGLMLMFTYLLVRLHGWIVGQIYSFINKIVVYKRVKIMRTIISFLILVTYLLIIGTGIVIISRLDPRMAELFDFSLKSDNPLLRYFNNLRFGERAVYWLVGWEIFGQYPLLGVGLGNAGFFFPEKITPYGWTLIEVRKLMYRTNSLLNIKSLWLRLLAETGIIGFSLFASWLITLLLAFLKISESKDRGRAFSSLAGIFVICALIAEGFSVDSFALPYMWIGLGLATSTLKIN